MDEVLNRLAAYIATHNPLEQNMPVGVQVTTGGQDARVMVLWSLGVGRSYADANDALREIWDWLEEHSE
jgi:hypothetical protein